jgi:sulfur-oxidizing protein SoxY
MKRRKFLQDTLAVAATWVAGSSGVLYSTLANAASRPDAAFLAKDVDTAMMEALGTREATTSDQIKLDAPLQAENGAVVPIEVSTSLPSPESIAVVVPNNPTPLLSFIETTPRSGSYFRMRIKMAGTDKVMVYVKSGGQWYVTSQEVRVAIGGCGG